MDRVKRNKWLLSIALLLPLLIAAEPHHAPRQEYKRHPLPGEWLAVQGKGEWHPSGAVYCCKHCGHYHAVRITPKMIEHPKPIGFTCSHCKRSARVLLDGLDLPPVGYQFPQTGIGTQSNYLTWWTYQGSGKKAWDDNGWKRTKMLFVDDEASRAPPFSLAPSMSDADWYSLYPIHTGDTNWINGGWQWLDKNKMSKP